MLLYKSCWLWPVKASRCTKGVYVFKIFNVNIFNLVSILLTHLYTHVWEETLAVFTRVAGNGVYLLCKWNGRMSGGGGQRSQIKWLCDDILCELSIREAKQRKLDFFFLTTKENFWFSSYSLTLRDRKILFRYSSFIIFYRYTFNDFCDTVLTVKRGNKSQQDLSKHNSCVNLPEPLEAVVVFSLQRNCRTFSTILKYHLPLPLYIKTRGELIERDYWMYLVQKSSLKDSKASLELCFKYDFSLDFFDIK